MDREYLNDILTESLEWGKQAIGEAIKSNSTYSTGKHLKSMKVKTTVDKEGQAVEGVLSTSLPWFEHLEKGRGPYTGWTGETGFAKAMADWNKHTGLPKAFTTDEERMKWATHYAQRVNRLGDTLYRSKKRRDIYTGIVEQVYRRIYNRLNVGDAFALDFGAILKKLTFEKPITIKP